MSAIICSVGPPFTSWALSWSGSSSLSELWTFLFKMSRGTTVKAGFIPSCPGSSSRPDGSGSHLALNEVPVNIPADPDVYI